MKTCTKCGETLLAQHFHKCARNKDGLKNKCKECACAESRGWRDSNLERARQYDKKRYAADPEKKCLVAKMWRELNPERSKANSKAYRLANKEKVSELRRAWGEKNKERKREIDSAWAKANPEKRRVHSAKYRAANRDKAKAATAKWQAANIDRSKAVSAKWRAANPEAIRTIANNRRARKLEAGGTLSKGLSDKLFKLQKGKCACGCKQELGNDFHLDHIMPLALGGTNTDGNIQLLRAKCNQQKSAKHPADFMRQRGFLI